jgi:hypothetical protein
MPLKLLGYWKAKFSDSYPCPQELEGELAESVREGLASYLENPPLLAGTARPVIRQSIGVSWCRYGCGVANGSTELSDGVWIWPQGLAHYVREHRLARLPEAFLERVAAHQLRQGVDLPVSKGEAPEIDESIWLAWAQKHRSAELEERFEALQAHCQRLAAEAVLAEGMEASLMHGTSNEPCCSEGCTGKALRVDARCGHCFALGQGGQFARAEIEEIAAFLASLSR